MGMTLVDGIKGKSLRMRPDPESLEAIQEGGALRFGLLPLDVRWSPERPDVIRLRSLAGKLLIPGEWRVHVRARDGEVMMGPVIGIFTSSRRPGSRRPFASLTERFRRMICLAREMGALAYVFTPAGIQWNTKVIQGYTYLPRARGGRWVRGIFPFPNVVYNRVPTRKAEKRRRVRLARLRLLNEPGLNLFNPAFLDKWTVYQILRQDEALRQHLPITQPCQNFSQLMAFLDQHRSVYLKMADGSLGKGTARVELTGDGRFRWHATRPGGQMIHRTLRGKAELGRVFKRLRRGRKYLMQQAVDLLHTKGRPFDIRALVQKDAAGHWQVTGMAARIAGKGQITTHRPRGGSRARLVPLIRSIFQDEVRTRKITQELHRVILKAAEVFDAATGHNHGELSMDVGLDRTGRPWIFEINSKPAVFDEPSIRRVARKRLLHYCFSRGGFPPKASGGAS